VTFRFEKPIIYLITNGEATESNFDDARRSILDTVHLAVEEKVSLIQLREKHLSARSLFELTAAAVAVTRNSATRLLVNDRADIALAAGADGVHLAANSLPVGVIRNSFPRDLIVGVSAHSVEEAVIAKRSGADFAVFGPVFESPGKGAPTGLAVLSEACSELGQFPVIGLGGINSSNYESVLAAGASGIAAIRFLNDPDSLRTISRSPHVSKGFSLNDR